MKIVKIKLKDLKVADYNPRFMDKRSMEKLKNSIEEFGYIEPIIYNKSTQVIIGGNHRYQILKEQFGDDHEIDVVMLDIDLKKEKALNLALNKIKGDWNEEKLDLILKDIDYSELSGFDRIKKEEINKFEEKLNIEEKIALTFWFDTEEEKKEFEKFFKTKKGLDPQRLRQLMVD